MNEQPNKENPQQVFHRRSGFSIFDFHKKPGWRLGTGDEHKGPFWYVAVCLSICFGILAVWGDIVDGVSPTRIGIVLIFVSGISYYFLLRFQQTLLWGAVLATSSSALATVLQLRNWFTNDVWPGWTMQDISIYSELVGTSEISFFAFIGEQSAILTLLILAVLSGVASLVVLRFRSS